MPASLFSDCLSYLLPAIMDIINTSLRTGSFPTAFKTAIVCPLLKQNNLDPNDLKNYRPVSNLPFISKLLEKTVLQQLNNHLSNNSLLHPFQYAYRFNHSTKTVLLHIVNNSLLASDSGKVSLLTLPDLSHCKILRKYCIFRVSYAFQPHRCITVRKMTTPIKQVMPHWSLNTRSTGKLSVI